MKHIVSLIVALSVVLLALASTATAQVPNQMQYQGYLTDDGGSPLDTTVDMVFVIYDDSIGSGIIWSETHMDVIVEDGLFEVILGSVTGVTGDVVNDSVRWLGITVGTDSEIHPRTKLVAVPYTFRVSTIDGATGGSIWGRVGIGVDEPMQELHIHSDGAPEVMLSSDVASSGVWAMGTGYDPFGADRLYFYDYNSGQSRLAIDAEGKVGIGTTDPEEKLHLYGKFFVESYSVPFIFRELGQSGAGSLWRMPLDGKSIRFDASNNGTDFSSVTTPLTMTEDGKVGIGTYYPLTELTIHGGPDTDDAALTFDVDGTDWYVGVDDSYGDKLRIGTGSAVGTDVAITIESDGDVGIGTGLASRALDVIGGIEADGVETESLRVDEVYFGTSSTEGYLIGSYLVLGAVGSYGVIELLGSDGVRSIELDASDGRVITEVLEITGGKDLAEPFAMSDENTIPQGALVVIDDQNPGQLKLSHRAYDTRVAGVISGAGGINPGLTLSQHEVLEGGQHVALTGQVYALADASLGAIRPGDLLTTSDTPGHAMKAADRDRAYGAVIGKAMTGLQEGQGLVLVLVNLQ